MPIYGSVSYAPYSGFAFPRPYIHQITFRFGVGAIVTHSDEDFFITDGTNPAVHVVCNLLPEFWATSSNRYTLDYVIVDLYALHDPDPTPIPLSWICYYRIDPLTIEPEIVIGLSGGTVYYPTAMPPAPAGYWTPT